MGSCVFPDFSQLSSANPFVPVVNNGYRLHVPVAHQTVGRWSATPGRLGSSRKAQPYGRRPALPASHPRRRCSCRPSTSS
ncbi:protein of unknown function [Streptomyces murinus]